jgi:hypothetical protein
MAALIAIAAPKLTKQKTTSHIVLFIAIPKRPPCVRALEMTFTTDFGRLSG